MPIIPGFTLFYIVFSFISFLIIYAGWSIPWTHLTYLMITLIINGVFHELGHGFAAVLYQVEEDWDFSVAFSVTCYCSGSN